MRMGQGVRTGLGHGGITCVLQTQFSSYICSIWKYGFDCSVMAQLIRDESFIIRWEGRVHFLSHQNFYDPTSLTRYFFTPPPPQIDDKEVYEPPTPYTYIHLPSATSIHIHFTFSGNTKNIYLLSTVYHSRS